MIAFLVVVVLLLSIVSSVVQKKDGMFVRAFEYYWAFCVFSLSQSGEVRELR